MNPYSALWGNCYYFLQCITQDAPSQKIEVSFSFKREALRIASDSLPILLVLLPTFPPPLAHHHLHLTGDEGVLGLF